MKNQVNLPSHIAIIPDGNRRWARERGLPTFEGHRRGYQQVIEIGRTARKMGIKYLTFWGFSTENWRRSKDEVNLLMDLFKQMIDQSLKDALKEKTKIIHLGRKDRFDEGLRLKIQNAEQKTENFNNYYLMIALDYGGRDEILRAIKKLHQANVFDSRNIDNLTEVDFEKFLDTMTIPPPDLVIRTSGEMRTSGFMIWQTAYAEWIFYEKFFPDFTGEDLSKCINEYQNRQRRFGR
jgi:undecaprenyl diphosphate synthase